MPLPTRKRSSTSGTFPSCRASVALALVVALARAGALAGEPLPALQAQSPVTVSGVSSGAYMAVQFHVAHSASVSGVGALGGGPYYCAQGSAWRAYHHCRRPGLFTPLPSVAALRAEAERQAQAGRIDPTGNLAAARAWLFSGGNDDTVAREVVEGLLHFYRQYRGRAVLVRHPAAGHGMPTQNAGHADCAASRPPFLNDCDYDAAGALLAHLLGPLLRPAGGAEGRLFAFAQRPFGGPEISLDAEGFVFVPRACEHGRCRVHVVFHGCRQGRSFVGDRFASEAGYNRWAQANRLIVLYPQVTTRYWGVYNPRGCWDWWGYTGRRYHTGEAPQIRAVKAMVERLQARRD